jgi:phage terminase large subunit-like protein
VTLAVVAPTRTRPVTKPKSEPEPFTLPHFLAWAQGMTFDTGDPVVVEPFQAEFIADVFSGKPECWLIVPEGNGKTTLVALLALYHAEFKSNASVPVAASSREQAEILYRQAEGFVLRSPRMYEVVHSDLQLAKGKRKTDVPRFTCLEGYRRINHFAGGRIQVFAADDRTGDGQIPTLGILDELHRHRDLALYRTWAGKLSKRKGQIIAISTAGEPGADFELTREKIRQSAATIIRRGSFIRAESPRIVLHEWAVPPKANVEDFGIVKSANPFSGHTVETLHEKFESPTMTLTHWRRFVCNVPTRDENSAIEESEWAAAIAKKPIPAGSHVWVGLDVAWKWDTTALVPYWWKSREHRQFGAVDVLVPPRDGTMLDPEDLKKSFRAVHKRTPIDVVVMDMADANDIAAWLKSELGAEVIDWPQSNAFQVSDYARFMDGLRNATLFHAGDAGLTEHALNAIVALAPLGDPKFERPSQSRNAAQQGRRVIDALRAASMVNSAAVERDQTRARPKPKLWIGSV